MREIKTIVIHCSATKPDMEVGVEEIRNWHTARGWSDVGYHYVINRKGMAEAGRSLDRVGAHVAGHNADTCGVCLVGGLDRNGNADFNFTLAQLNTLRSVVAKIAHDYPTVDKICGHRDFPGVAKACPCFDVEALLGDSWH